MQNIQKDSQLPEFLKEEASSSFDRIADAIESMVQSDNPADAALSATENAGKASDAADMREGVEGADAREKADNKGRANADNSAGVGTSADADISAVADISAGADTAAPDDVDWAVGQILAAGPQAAGSQMAGPRATEPLAMPSQAKSSADDKTATTNATGLDDITLLEAMVMETLPPLLARWLDENFERILAEVIRDELKTRKLQTRTIITETGTAS